MHIPTTSLKYLRPEYGRVGGPSWLEDNDTVAFWDYDDFMVWAFMIGVDKIGVEAYRFNSEGKAETLACTTVTDLDDAITAVEWFADVIGHDPATADKLAAFKIDPGLIESGGGAMTRTVALTEREIQTLMATLQADLQHLRDLKQRDAEYDFGDGFWDDYIARAEAMYDKLLAVFGN